MTEANKVISPASDEWARQSAEHHLGSEDFLREVRLFNAPVNPPVLWPESDLEIIRARNRKLLNNP
jgi:hypothetical protein